MFNPCFAGEKTITLKIPKSHTGNGQRQDMNPGLYGYIEYSFFFLNTHLRMNEYVKIHMQNLNLNIKQVGILYSKILYVS